MQTAATAWMSVRGAFRGNESTDFIERPSVDHVARLHQSTPRHDEAQRHLSVEPLGAVTITVDRDHRSSGDGAARELAVEVQVRRGSVDFHDGPGLDGHPEQPIVVQLVTGL